MTTVQEVVDILKDDFQRNDIDARILAAVNAAHKHYQGEQTWFNEATASLTTSSSQAAYTTADGVPQYIAKVRLITLTQNSSNVYPLEPITFDRFFTINTAPSTTLGLPGQYTWYNGSLMLYTTPDGAYPVHLYYCRGYGTLTAAESTVWLDHAQELIEARASYWLATRVTLEPERATTARMLEAEALNEIRHRTWEINSLSAPMVNYAGAGRNFR